MSLPVLQESQSIIPGEAREPEKTDHTQSLSVSLDLKHETRTQIVDWDGPTDPQNPMNWSPARKWAIIALVSTITFNTYVV